MEMPIYERTRYFEFVWQLTADLGIIPPPDSMLWHYTSGSALIDIVQTGTIFATQLSGLNDSTELRYGSKLLQEALASLRVKYKGDATSLQFIDNAVRFFTEDTNNPTQPVVGMSR